MKILGIETSCDETAAAVVTGDGAILSNIVLSQLDEHRVFGGVVPEIAARAHLDHIDRVIAAALADAQTESGDLTAIAATCGPGLIGGVMVGMMAGKAIAAAHGLPFIAVNHLEAHALTPRLTDAVSFPYLLLLVSGGHTQIIAVEGVGRYRQLGGTIDDALGECFDKAAKLMGLPYPGGPNLEKAALACADPENARRRFPLPAPLKGRPGCDFSFSGLKTAIRNHIEKLPAGALRMQDVADLAAAFQQTVCETLADRCANALKIFRDDFHDGKGDKDTSPAFVIAGGVAANCAVRTALAELAARQGMSFVAPPGRLCSDNGAMIAWAGVEHWRLGHSDSLAVAARPRWPLDPAAGRHK